MLVQAVAGLRLLVLESGLGLESGLESNFAGLGLELGLACQGLGFGLGLGHPGFESFFESSYSCIAVLLTNLLK